MVLPLLGSRMQNKFWPSLEKLIQSVEKYYRTSTQFGKCAQPREKRPKQGCEAILGNHSLSMVHLIPKGTT
jgi:uncharacterized radical SAM superfamily protein